MLNLEALIKHYLIPINAIRDPMSMLQIHFHPLLTTHHISQIKDIEYKKLEQIKIFSYKSNNLNKINPVY
jgi:hypothetical protein